MVLIDLGELRDANHPDPPARPHRPSRLPPLLLALLLVALATLVAAAPLPVRNVVVLPLRQSADNVIVAGGLLLVVDPPDRPGGPHPVTAFRLPGGTVAWRSSLPVAGEYWSSSAQDGLLLITGYDPAQDDHTVALDARTGAYRWHRPGSALPVAGGGLLLLETGEDGTETLRVVEPCCGTPRWRATVPAGGLGYRFTDAGVDRVLLTDPGGRVEVHDAGTGAVLAAGDLPAAPARGTQIVADLLVSIDGTRVTGYGVQRLDRRWETTVPDAGYATGCGALLCVQSGSGVLRALDATTGHPVWTAEGWNEVLSMSGRLLVTRFTIATESPELAVLDPATGRVLAELGRWKLLHSTRSDAPLLGVRPHPAGGLFVAELDLASAAVRPLDVLPGAYGDCGVSGETLLCRRHDGTLGLWPLRR